MPISERNRATLWPADATMMSTTVLDHVTPEMRIYHEESCGPVVSVVCVSGGEEDVHNANDTEYGLCAAVFGRDIARAMPVAELIESRICHINGPALHHDA